MSHSDAQADHSGTVKSMADLCLLCDNQNKMGKQTSTDDTIFTAAVHAGEGEPPPEGNPVATPIFPAVTYVYRDTGILSEVLGFEREGYCYARYGSPTIGALEKAVAALENAPAAVAFSSGMAALHVTLMQAGVRYDTAVLAAADLYGATRSLLKQLVPSNERLSFVDITDLDAVRAAIAELRPRVVLFEMMSNPLLKIPDLPSLAQAAHSAGAVVIVDSTFATPFLIRPLQLGADFVVHSATKYLGGHGDVLGGVVATDAPNAGCLRETLKTFGSNLGPFEAWTVLRGIKTLPLRMREQCANAMKVSHWLRAHSRVGRVWYPGLTTHPQHELAKNLFRPGCFGAVVTFELNHARPPQVYRFMEALKLIQSATSLGDVYSMVLYPAISSHRALSRDERLQIGITDGLVRLSVGIESVIDIIADLDQALAASLA